MKEIGAGAILRLKDGYKLSDSIPGNHPVLNEEAFNSIGRTLILIDEMSIISTYNVDYYGPFDMVDSIVYNNIALQNFDQVDYIKNWQMWGILPKYALFLRLSSEMVVVLKNNGTRFVSNTLRRKYSKAINAEAVLKTHMERRDIRDKIFTNKVLDKMVSRLILKLNLVNSRAFKIKNKTAAFREGVPVGGPEVPIYSSAESYTMSVVEPLEERSTVAPEFVHSEPWVPPLDSQVPSQDPQPDPSAVQRVYYTENANGDREVRHIRHGWTYRNLDVSSTTGS